MIEKLLNFLGLSVVITFLIIRGSNAQDIGSIIKGLGTLESFYAARGDTGYINYLKRVKKQIQLDKSIGKHKNMQHAMLAQTLIDLYIYSFAPASIDDSTKQKLFSTAERFLSQCEEEQSPYCIELMKAIIHAYIADNQLLKAYLTNEKLKQIISLNGIQDTFVYLLTLYNMAKLGVLMYNEQIIKLTEQEIEEFIPHIPSPKYYPLIGFIYNALGVGKKPIPTTNSLQQQIKTLRKAEQFLSSSELDKATKKTLSIIYGNIADAYLDLADSAITKNDTNSFIAYWDSAKLYIQKSLKLAKETDNLLTVIYDRFRLAILTLQQGDTAQAYAKMQQILDDVRNMELHKTIIMPILSEHLIYAAKGVQKYNTAIDLCPSVIAYYDTLQVEIINLASSFFQESIKMKRKKELALQNVQKYRYKCDVVAVLIGIIIFLGFAIWAWLIYKKNTKVPQT